MRRLVVAVVVLAAVLAGADVVARMAAEDQLADRAQAASSAARSTTADIRSFPFVARLLASGAVGRVVVRQDGVTAGELTFASVTVDLRGVRVDRDRLVTAREVVLRDVEGGEVTAELTQEMVSSVVGVPVHFADGRASVTLAGVRVGVDAAVVDGTLVLGAAGESFPVALPDVPFLPCVATVRVVPGRVALSCDVDDVPRELVERAARRVTTSS